MRIAIAAEPIRNGAGLGTFVSDALRALAKARPRWQFLVVVSSWYTEIQQLDNINNVNIYVWDYSGLRSRIMDGTPNFRGRFRLLNYLSRFAPSKTLRLSLGNLTERWKSLPTVDVLWVPYFDNSLNCWPALYKPDLIKCPILLTIHDLPPLLFREHWKKNPKTLKNFNEKFIPFVQRSQCIITHSNFQKSSIVEHLKIRPDKISVVYIPMPVNHELCQIHPKEEVRRLLERFGISKPYAFSPLSQTAPHKNHSRLFEVWEILKRKLGKECPMLVFTIKGDRHRQREFEKCIKLLGIEDKVVFTGLVNKSELAMLYQECEFVVFPSLYEGGGGYPVLEGCAIGKSVLCSRIPPILEQVQRFNLPVNFFDPMDNESIMEAIQKVLAETTKATPETNCNVNQNTEKEWVEFGESYCKQIESIAALRKSTRW